MRDSQCTLVECQARDVVERRLEVQLSGVVPSIASQHKVEHPSGSMLLRDKTPSAGSRGAPESVVVGESKQWLCFFTVLCLDMSLCSMLFVTLMLLCSKLPCTDCRSAPWNVTV